MKRPYGVLSNFKQFIESMRGRGVRYIFHGTQEEWDALSDEEKDRYDQAEVIGWNGDDSANPVVEDLSSACAIWSGAQLNGNHKVTVWRMGKLVVVNFGLHCNIAGTDIVLIGGLPKPRVTCWPIPNTGATYTLNAEGELHANVTADTDNYCMFSYMEA